MNAHRALAAALLACLCAVVQAAPAVERASDWLGSLVVAPNGEEIGTIRDFAIDPSTGKVVYIVVSVGSFLIENNLIAVRPDALTPSGDHEWTLYTDVETLRRARRFAIDQPWPSHPDVGRTLKNTADAQAPRTAPRVELSEEEQAPATQGGTATISTGTKTAFLSGGERYIKEVEAKPTAQPMPAIAPERPVVVAPYSGPPTRFDRLDKDGDGVLNRSEIALEMGPKDKYSKVDANANGVIEREEFDTLLAARATQ